MQLLGGAVVTQGPVEPTRLGLNAEGWTWPSASKAHAEAPPPAHAHAPAGPAAPLYSTPASRRCSGSWLNAGEGRRLKAGLEGESRVFGLLC